jgi:hypothetical protein
VTDVGDDVDDGPTELVASSAVGADQFRAGYRFVGAVP